MGSFIAHQKSTFCILHAAQLHYGTLCTKRFCNNWHSTNAALSLVGSHISFDVIHVTSMLRCMFYFCRLRLKKKIFFSLFLFHSVDYIWSLLVIWFAWEEMSYFVQFVMLLMLMFQEPLRVDGSSLGWALFFFFCPFLCWLKFNLNIRVLDGNNGFSS